MLCVEGSAGEERGRPSLPVSFPILSDGKEGNVIKSCSDPDEGTNLQQLNVVHHWVGCQKLAEVLPSGVEHQLYSGFFQWSWMIGRLHVELYIFMSKAMNNQTVSSYNCPHKIKTNRLFPFLQWWEQSSVIFIEFYRLRAREDSVRSGVFLCKMLFLFSS